MTIANNLVPNEPSLADLLKLVQRNMGLAFNCHHIASIQSFNASKQIASATVNYQKTLFQPDAVSGVYEPVLINYPVLVDCPVLSVGGGTGCLTFPIAKGDECIVMFNDRDIDNWFQGGGQTAPNNTPRVHSFSDGIILVGVRSLANVIPNYSTSAIELRTKDGTNKVSITTSGISVQVGTSITLQLDNVGGVKITNAQGEFVTMLVKLFTDLQTATAGGFPLVMPTFAADLLKLESFQS